MQQASHYFYITPEEYEEAAHHGVSAATLEVRIRTLAWPKERAIHTLPHEKRSLCDWVEIAEQNGICYSTLRYRANRLGWDVERAATQPLQDRKAQAKYAYEQSRKYPVKYLELARKNGIHEDTFRRRIRSGWDIELAATRPPMTSRECGLLTKSKRNLRYLFPRRRKLIFSRKRVILWQPGQLEKGNGLELCWTSLGESQ